MNWGIICRPDRKKSVSLARDVFDFLTEKDTVFCENGVAKALEQKGLSLKEINKKSDVVVTIGGDGTILWALKEIEKPIFAINSGGMGFLAEVESKYTIEGLKRVSEGNYNVEERSKLKIILDGKRLPDATNEATVQSNKIGKIMYMKIFVDGEPIESMGADGVIVASATGSTSYSLSVGGPVMDPSVNAMIIAPIAPFKLSARPWIVPLKRQIQVIILPKSKESKIVIDGSHEEFVNSKSELIITGSEKKARFVRFGESFYQMFRLKLMR